MSSERLYAELKKLVAEKTVIVLLPRQPRPDGAHSDPVPFGPLIIDGVYLVREKNNASGK